MKSNAPQSEEISLSPSKDTYDAVQSDVTPISAIKELIDNSIDNWERVYNKSKNLIVEISYDFDQDTFSIEDNGGGLEEENIEKLFSLGETTKGEIDTPIGAYGVGAKKAIVKIGETAELVSRYKDQDYGFGYTIDQSWLRDSDNWNVIKEAYENIEPGRTKITISDLKLDVGETTVKDDDDFIGEESSFSSEDFFSRVKSELSETYEEYLKPDEAFTGDLIINFNGEQIEAPTLREWSFTPFDGFYPRTYKNITLKRHNLKSPIFLDVTVGLTRKGNQDTAGTDIFCQNRKVVSNNDGTVGGFGRDDLDIGELSSTRSRLRVRMYFRTEGNADRLPWDTQKNGIDEYDSLMQEAYEWVEKIVYPYWQASSYDNMSKHVVEPYGSDSKQAANNGTIRSFSYRDRTRLSDRPNNEFEDVEKLNETLNPHLDLEICAPQLILPKFRPAYKSAFDSTDETTVEVSEVPIGLSDSEVRDIIQRVRKVAREDVNESVQRDVDKWWKPVYDTVLEDKREEDQELEKIDQGENNDIGAFDQRESAQTSSDKKNSGDLEQSQFDSEGISSQSNVKDSNQEEPAREETTEGNHDFPKNKPDDENNATQTTRDTSDDRSAVQEKDDIGAVKTDNGRESNQQKQQRNSKTSTSSQGPDYPTGYREVDGKPVVMSFSEENRKCLCEYLELPVDVGKNRFNRVLKEAIISEMVEGQ